MTDIAEHLRGCANHAGVWGADLLKAAEEIERLRRERDYHKRCEENLEKHCNDADAEIGRLRAALRDMVDISQRNSEANLMLIAVRKCAEHALGDEQEAPPDWRKGRTKSGDMM